MLQFMGHLFVCVCVTFVFWNGLRVQVELWKYIAVKFHHFIYLSVSLYMLMSFQGFIYFNSVWYENVLALDIDELVSYHNLTIHKPKSLNHLREKFIYFDMLDV